MFSVVGGPIENIFVYGGKRERGGGLYHGGQRRVQAGLCLAVIRIAVLVAPAVVDKTDLEVHPTLQPATHRNTSMTQT